MVHAVTVETEAVLVGWQERRGGDTDPGVGRAGRAVGGFTGWRSAMPVTIWAVTGT